jgi:hypothetical protein
MHRTTRCIAKTFWHLPTNAAKLTAARRDGWPELFEDIETYGVKRWQDELGPPPFSDGVMETAAVLVLEPIFEADLPPENSMPIGVTMAHWTRCARSTH